MIYEINVRFCFESTVKIEAEDFHSAMEVARKNFLCSNPKYEDNVCSSIIDWYASSAPCSVNVFDTGEMK